VVDLDPRPRIQGASIKDGVVQIPFKAPGGDPASFRVVRSAGVEGPYEPVAAEITLNPDGSYIARVPAGAAPSGFFRIVR